MTGIGSLNEKALHSALKDWAARPGDRIEFPVDGYVIDIVRENLLIEIQTRNFSAVRHKLNTLVQTHPIQLIFPVAGQKWIVRLPAEPGQTPSCRKSPKRGSVLQVYEELVSFPELMCHPNFSLHVVIIKEEEVRRFDPKRGWRRRGWTTHERRLREVDQVWKFNDPDDFKCLIPDQLPAKFTTSDLAERLKRPRDFSQKMAYCLNKMNLIHRIGKQGNAFEYARVQE